MKAILGATSLFDVCYYELPAVQDDLSYAPDAYIAVIRLARDRAQPGCGISTDAAVTIGTAPIRQIIHKAFGRFATTSSANPPWSGRVRAWNQS